MRTEIVFLPVFHQNHWALAVIFPEERTIMMLDSLEQKLVTEGYGRRVRDLMWFVDPRPRETDPKKDWRFLKATTQERQQGAVECGIFVIARMLEIAFDTPPGFGQEHVDTLRKGLYHSLKAGKLTLEALPPFE